MDGRAENRRVSDRVGRILALGAAVALGVSLSAPIPTAANEAWAIYRHPNPSFMIVHPADWTAVGDVHGVPFGTHVMIGAKRQGDGDAWPLHVLVRSIPLLPRMTLDAVERDWWAYVRSPKPGHHHLRLDRTEIDGRPVLIGYSIQPAPSADRSSYVIEMIVITSGRLYVVDARAPAASRDLMGDIARLRQIMMTFRVL